MVKRTRFPLWIVSNNYLRFVQYHSIYLNITLRKICWYSTAATDEAAYIIGGFQNSNYSPTIAEFKNDRWRKLGDLTHGRQVHGSISVGQQTMVVGGNCAGYVFRKENCSQNFNSYGILITLIQQRKHRSMGIGRRKQQSHCPITTKWYIYLWNCPFPC